MSVSMSDNTPQSFFKKHRLPIMLAIVAVGLYVFSILYILFAKGQIV